MNGPSSATVASSAVKSAASGSRDQRADRPSTTAVASASRAARQPARSARAHVAGAERLADQRRHGLREAGARDPGEGEHADADGVGRDRDGAVVAEHAEVDEHREVHHEALAHAGQRDAHDLAEVGRAPREVAHAQRERRAPAGFAARDRHEQHHRHALREQRREPAPTRPRRGSRSRAPKISSTLSAIFTAVTTSAMRIGVRVSRSARSALSSVRRHREQQRRAITSCR